MYLIAKKDVARIAEALSVEYDLYGPYTDTVSGQVFFGNVSSPNEIELDAAIPSNPPKQVLFPQMEPVLRYRYERETKRAAIERIDAVRPKALIGLRSCDLEGLLCLDRFFLGQEFVDEFYLAHRKRVFVVANTCALPFPQCFCVCTDSGPSPREGFDLALTDLGGDYLVETGGAKGTALAEKLGLRRAAKEHLEAKERVVDNSIDHFDALANENKAWISRVTNRVTTGFIKEDTWEYIGDQCFECGACTFVCPSCSCFNIEDAAAEAGCSERLRCWDSCAFEGYTRMAGDHNPRKPVEDRRNKRFFCKLSYSQSKKYLRPGCVGCGRCAWVCPGDIGLPNVVTYVRREIEKQG
jgi:sulfhydrogenase subunit beta (sulfur reductase)